MSEPATEAGLPAKGRLWELFESRRHEPPITRAEFITAVAEVEQEAAAIERRRTVELMENEGVVSWGDDRHRARFLDDEVARSTPEADRCDYIVNNGMGEPTECGRTLPCEYHERNTPEADR